MNYTVLLPDEEATVRLGESIAAHLTGGAFIALRGGLGTGKTVLTRGLAKGLGVRERLASPTFTVMNRYEGDKVLCHFDLYRVTEEDCLQAGFDEYFFDPAVVCAVEWSERLTEFPQNLLIVELVATGENTRTAYIKDEGNVLDGNLNEKQAGACIQ